MTGAAGATALLLIAASVVVFGPAVWVEYQHNLSVLRAVILEDGSGAWHRMVSVFVFVLRLGGGVELSCALQMAAGIGAALVVGWSRVRNDPAYIRNALVVVGTCLATPYLQDYDLMIGAFVAVWLKNAQQHSKIDARWFRRRGGNGAAAAAPGGRRTCQLQRAGLRAPVLDPVLDISRCGRGGAASNRLHRYDHLTRRCRDRTILSGGDPMKNAPQEQHFDALIVGAGLSDIGAGYHLQPDEE